MYTKNNVYGTKIQENITKRKTLVADPPPEAFICTLMYPNMASSMAQKNIGPAGMVICIREDLITDDVLEGTPC